MSRDPYAGGYYNPGGGGYDSGSDDDSGDSGGVDTGDVLDGGGSSGSDQRARGSSGGVRDDLVEDTLDDGGSSSGSGPGGSSPPSSDVGGADPEPETVSGSTSIAASATPGPRAPVQPGGDSGIIDSIATAEATPEIVERATTGGLLSERGESAGVLPDEIGGVDISETRAREAARGAAAFGDRMDLSAAFSSPADPLASGGEVREGRPVGTPDPENENPAEEFVEGGAQAFTNLPAGVLQAETGAEVAQSSPGIAQDFSPGEIGETGVAVGRDIATRTAADAASNPAEFAGGVATGAALGAGVLSRGSTGGLGTAVRAELDPRVGPFGTTAETRVVRRARSFLDDDRGQVQIGRQRGDGDSAAGSTVSDDADLGPDVGPFDRSDRRLYDPDREFGDDVGGMADPDIDAPSSSNPSQADIDGGIGGRGDPQMAPGVDAESFSERGFGDVTGTSLDPNPTDTLGSGVSPAGAGAGGLFGVPQQDATGTGVGGALGAPESFDATGVDPTGDADTLGGVDLDTGFGLGSDADTSPGIDTDTPGDTRTDAPTDTRTDVPADIDSPTRIDAAADLDARETADSTRADTRDPDLADPTPRDPRDPGDRRAPRDPDLQPDAEDETDAEESFFGVDESDRTFGSGFASGGERLADLFGR